MKSLKRPINLVKDELAFNHDNTIDWPDYFMGMASYVSVKSKDPNTKVGCVVVGEDLEVRSTGFNGIPRGVDDRPSRMERPDKYMWTSHAEENAVAHAARTGVSLKGSTAYTTHSPCARCARMLIQAGVETIVIGDGVTTLSKEEHDVADIMMREAGIRIERRY